MFAKLLKHEWRATAGLLGILSLAALGLSVLGTVILRVLTQYGDTFTKAGNSLVIMVLSTMLFFLFLALVGYMAGTQVILIVRFYKNKFTDQGYLTFTLPVNCHQIFLSSLVNMVVWTVISIAVLIVVILIVFLFGTASEGLINPDILPGISRMLSEIREIFQEQAGETFLPLNIASGVVGLFSGVVTIMTCLTVGAVLARKHKIIAAFGAYYLLSVVTSIASTFCMTVLSLANMASTADDAVQLMQYTYLIDLFLQIAVIIGGYFLSVWLMKKKLNLT